MTYLMYFYVTAILDFCAIQRYSVTQVRQNLVMPVPVDMVHLMLITAHT